MTATKSLIKGLTPGEYAIFPTIEGGISLEPKTDGAPYFTISAVGAVEVDTSLG